MMSKVTQDGRRRRLIGRAAMERLLTFPPTPTPVTGNGNGYGHGDDLREEDVWGNYSAEPPPATATTSAAAAPPARRRRWFEKGGLSAAFEDSSAAATTRSPISALRAIPATSRVAPAPPTSAPVSVPEWGSGGGGGGGLREFRYADDGDDEEEEDYVDYVDEEYYYAKRVPPHEYLAAQAARSGTKTMSVVEGVGRTLKGRDMSRVRDAVWNQTGFLG